MLKHLVLAGRTWISGDGQLETPKGHPLAEHRYSSLNSTSVLESSYCLTPPGGLDAEPAAGVPVWQWGKILCENNFLVSVVSCACRKKQTRTACSAQYLPPCCTTDSPVSETEEELHPLRKIYFFRPQILIYFLHFHRRVTQNKNLSLIWL